MRLGRHRSVNDASAYRLLIERLRLVTFMLAKRGA
jgi:hypothetical protein